MKKEEAIKISEQLFQSHSTDLESYLDIGEKLRLLCAYPQAISCFEKALEIDSGCGVACRKIGLVYSEISQYDHARKHFTRAIELDGGNPDFHHDLGILNLRLNNLAESFKNISAAIKLDPQFSTAYNNLGIIFERLELYDRAKKCHQKVIEINRTKAEASLRSIQESENKL